MTSRTFRAGTALTTAIALALPSQAYAQARPSGTQRTQQAMMNDVPHCLRKLGTVSVMDGDDPSGWTQFQIERPAEADQGDGPALGLFDLVDRGSGLSAAPRERDIGGGMGMQRGANVGQGQIKAADYVLVAEVQAADSNSGGGGGARRAACSAAITGFGAALGGMSSAQDRGEYGPVADQRPHHETVAVQDGYAAKNSISWGGGGGGFFGAGFRAGRRRLRQHRHRPDRHPRLHPGLFEDGVRPRVGHPGVGRHRRGDPGQDLHRKGSVAMRVAAGAGARVVRTLPPGAVVYPTGARDGLWWQVADENDNVGWVMNTKLAPSR